MRRVVLTGSESTGKTSLAAVLAAHYGAELVPEFVRDYAARKKNVIDFSDHGPIARGQIVLEEKHRARALARGARLLVQDTDLLSTMVYCEHYFGQCPEWIVEEARNRRPDLYLLLDIDIPWVPDLVRDRGDRREELQSLFTAAVLASGTPHVLVRGSHDERRAAAIEAIEGILRHET
jgi:nicotinamide riboside kinase